jgi:alkylated DNA nucleotide flippase Atl1
MRAFSHIERDDFDRWVGWILATATRDAYPPSVVWHRIVNCLVNSDERFQEPRCGPGKDRGFEMVA